ncbi:MAG: hypothetical protein QOI77_699 [Blastocatellia bacterium]|jgi:hypothetical protein|nr:hypothetical protein [Blastocatellia bacterium]
MFIDTANVSNRALCRSAMMSLSPMNGSDDQKSISVFYKHLVPTGQGTKARERTQAMGTDQ